MVGDMDTARLCLPGMEIGVDMVAKRDEGEGTLVRACFYIIGL